jgi:hypothetical protein
MRKWHRWLSVLFGVLILFIAVTGLLSHGAALYADSVAEPERAMALANPIVPAAQAHEREAHATTPAAITPAAATTTAGTPALAAFTCPETMTCRVKPHPDSPRAWVSFFHHLHAGEEFGPIGTALSIASGFALLFFAFSGLWMYIQMYRRRAHRESHPKRIFW